MSTRSVKAHLPDLASELEQLLILAKEDGLAAQVADLEMVAPCACDDSFCASFYTRPKPNGPWGPMHRNVVVRPRTGMLILDVVDEVISFVEVLDRDDVRREVRRVFDLWSRGGSNP